MTKIIEGKEIEEVETPFIDRVSKDLKNGNERMKKNIEHIQQLLDRVFNEDACDENPKEDKVVKLSPVAELTREVEKTNELVVDLTFQINRLRKLI